MKKIINKSIPFFILLALITFTVDLQAQPNAYRVSDNNVQRILKRIENRTDRFKRNMNTALDRSRYNDTKTEDRIFDFITEFENATDKLNRRFEDRKSVDADVTNVLNRAVAISNFMKRNRLTAAAQRDWGYLKTDLNTLARYYNVSFDWTVAETTNSSVYTKPYRVSDENVKAVLTRIETRTDNFKRRMNTALDRSTLNNTEKEDMVFEYITEFENATDRLKQKFDAKESVNADVNNVLSRAASIDAFMKRNNLMRGAEQNWLNIKSDLNLLSNYYNIKFDWTKLPVDNPTVAYNVSANNVQGLLTGLESKTDTYKRLMNTALDRSILNNSRSEDAIMEYITNFENSTDRLKQNFDAGKSTDQDVQEVLNRAAFIDTFMRDYRLMNSAERQWLSIKNDLNTLSNYYVVSWNWDRQYEPISRFDSMITGTYRLNPALSDNVDVVVENAVKLYPNSRENRVERILKNRLASPNMLVVSKNNAEVAVGSSNAPKIMFRADGITRNETNDRGQTIKVSARSTYDGVSLNYEGERMNDFYVNFMPISENRLKVVRRINIAGTNDTVTIASIYDKVNQTAQWNMIGDGTFNDSNTSVVSNDNFVVPNGTKIMAVLKSGVSTKSSQDGDRFMMEVVSPSIYQGAIIEGRIINAKRSGVFSGRANVSLDFDTIRLRNGNTYKFAGLIENVTLANGEKVTVNNEGQVRDNNQTSKTVKRAGIGAGVGAILGAILGGGDGAAIGAAIGGAAGAGTVVAQGRDDVELEEGTEVLITATAPQTVGRFN